MARISERNLWPPLWKIVLISIQLWLVQNSGSNMMMVMANGEPNWWKDCSSKDAAVKFNRFEFHPEQIHFGDNVTVGGSMTVSAPVSNRTLSVLEVWRRISFLSYSLNLRIACIHEYGSCIRPLCTLLSDTVLLSEWYQAATNRTSSCANELVLAPDSYSSYNIATKFPQFFSIAETILSGLYRINWRWLDYEGKEIACVQGGINIS